MAKQRNQLYEGMYILSATLSDDARQKALEKVLSGITDRSGEIHKIFEQGRRKMAYEINGRREGYYYVIYFSTGASCMAEMWKEYHLNEDLIRFLTLRAESVPEKLEYKQLMQE
ncbi:MAG: 30S ribosomal protein S6 [Chlamydiota bacterium]